MNLGQERVGRADIDCSPEGRDTVNVGARLAFGVLAAVVLTSGNACFAQAADGHRATVSGAEHQQSAPGKTGQSNTTSQTATNTALPPQPKSVRYLNYAQYDPWAFVPQVEQRNLATPSPGYGRNGISVSTPTGLPQSNAASKNTSVSPANGIEYHGPNPSEMRQHYAHYTPGAFSRCQSESQKSTENAVPAAAPQQALKYSEFDLSPTSTGEADSYGSRLNF